MDDGWLNRCIARRVNNLDKVPGPFMTSQRASVQSYMTRSEQHSQQKKQMDFLLMSGAQ